MKLAMFGLICGLAGIVCSTLALMETAEGEPVDNPTSFTPEEMAQKFTDLYLPTERSPTMTVTKTKFRPIGDHAVIRRDEAPDKTEGGIILPENAKSTPFEGTVVAVGPGYYREGEYVPLEIRVGDSVVFPAFVGAPVEIDGEKYVVVRENEILSILE